MRETEVNLQAIRSLSAKIAIEQSPSRRATSSINGHWPGFGFASQATEARSAVERQLVHPASAGNTKVEIKVRVVLIGGVKSLLLGLLQPGKYVRLSVKDYGRGISSDTLPLIFEPFFTTKATIAERGLTLLQFMAS